MEPIKDNKFGQEVDQLIVDKARELRYDIVNLKKMLEEAEQKLADLEPTETEIKTIRENAREKRREIEARERELTEGSGEPSTGDEPTEEETPPIVEETTKTTGRDQQETETPTGESPTP